MDDFISLSNRLLSRCPAVGVILSQQLVNDSWRTFQARRQWSFRRRFGTFAPPNLYQTGYASSNVASGNPNLITGTGTTWTPQMVGSQIRVGGLLFPFYTIVGYLSPTQLLIDQPWAGPDVTDQAYNILQIYYPVPNDFGFFYTVVSIKDSYRLWTNLTESDLAVMDPQRTNYGQTYAVVYRGFTGAYGGSIGPVLPITNPASNSPVSTTTNGYSYVANASYIIQVVTGGVMGVATFQWLRAGQTAFQPSIPTSDQPQDLSDGVQIYWPDSVSYTAGDLFIINCTSQVTQSVPMYELWPGPTYNGYLYPYIYIAKEYDLTVAQPQLPPFVANRGEILLEMALQKCAEFPGADVDHPNIYHDLRQAQYHGSKAEIMIEELERNDEEVGVTNIEFQEYPYAPSPWMTGQWQQTHAPFLNG